MKHKEELWITLIIAVFGDTTVINNTLHCILIYNNNNYSQCLVSQQPCTGYEVTEDGWMDGIFVTLVQVHIQKCVSVFPYKIYLKY